MLDLKKIETSVLLAMLAAYSSSDGKVPAVDETEDSKTVICLIQDEIASRKEAEEKQLLHVPAIRSV